MTEPPFNAGTSLKGTFSFTSSIPVAAAALRGFTNERGEFLMTTLPLAEIGAAGVNAIAHFAHGGGWTTEVVLVNPSDARIRGTAQFLDQRGAVVQTADYDIAPGSSDRVITAGTTLDVRTGSVRLSSPAAAAGIFSLTVNGVTVTQAGVPAQAPAMAFRTYIEKSATTRSGVAMANPSASAIDVTLEVSGVPAVLTIPPNGQTAFFIDEIQAYAGLTGSFKGVMRITSPSPVAVTGLRGHVNERGEFLVAATPPVDEATGAASELIFPHYAEGGGYSMQFILFGGPPSGMLSFFDQTGSPSSLTFPLPFR